MYNTKKNHYIYLIPVMCLCSSVVEPAGPDQVNPCYSGSHDCDTTAQCLPQEGQAFQCQCATGYRGDGRNCYGTCHPFIWTCMYSVLLKNLDHCNCFYNCFYNNNTFRQSWRQCVWDSSTSVQKAYRGQALLSSPRLSSPLLSSPLSIAQHISDSSQESRCGLE